MHGYTDNNFQSGWGVYLPQNNHTMRKSCFGHSINSEYPEQASAFIQDSKYY